MKSFIVKSIFILPLFFLVGKLMAQPPAGIPFQAVAKDPLGNPAKSRKVFVKDIIIQNTPNGNKVWEEAHETQTNEDGVYTITIGRGTKATAIPIKDLSQIDWANGPFFINVKMAVAPSIPAAWWVAADNYLDMGTTQMMSVPYALFAGNASVTNVTQSITPGPINTFLTTDSLGNVAWTTPQSANVNITQVSNNIIELKPPTGVIGRDLVIGANTTTTIKVPVPGAEIGDPVLIAAQGDYTNFNIYNAFVSAPGEVTVRFANFQKKSIPVAGNLYKIVLIK